MNPAYADGSPERVLAQLHKETASELAFLLDGFFLNIESQVYEIARQRERGDRETFETIRELLSKRREVADAFLVLLDTTDAEHHEMMDSPEYAIASECASRCRQHFSMLLSRLQRRFSDVVDAEVDSARFPVAPERFCCLFVTACRDVCGEGTSLRSSAELFQRLVLARLGNFYSRAYALLGYSGHLPA